MAATLTGALGQVAPAATVRTVCYAVPAGRRATVRVLVTNTGGDSSFRVSVAANGAADAVSQYIARDYPIAAADSRSSAPITLGSLDEIRVSSASGAMSFTVTGFEQDET